MVTGHRADLMRAATARREQTGAGLLYHSIGVLGLDADIVHSLFV
jgi:hypothetical protein